MEPHDQTSAPARRAGARWTFGTVLLTLVLLCLFAAPTVYIDPLFHYHAPLEQYQYPLNDERYQNDGITRHFDYDSIITGTSMTENFKTSEADALFGANFIKVPYSAGTYKETDSNLRQAYKTGHDLRYVIRGLDLSVLIVDKDALQDFDYPFYLYNDNPFDDLSYVLNKTVLLDRTLEVIHYTAHGGKTTTFDEYSFWSDDFSYGAEAVLGDSTFSPPDFSPVTLPDDQRAMIQANVQQNVVDLALEHPETTFYLFIPPYSIAYWGSQYVDGRVAYMISAEQTLIEMLVQVPNVRLYAFDNNFDLVCDLSNYRDAGHYGEWVNSWILEQFQSDEYLLTQDNYQDYLDTIRQFYTTYDYPSLNLLK